MLHSHIHAPRHAAQIPHHDPLPVATLAAIPTDATTATANATAAVSGPGDVKKAAVKGYGYGSLTKQHHDVKVNYSLINFCAIHGDPLPVSLVEGESDCHCAAKNAFKKVANPDHQEDALTVSIEAISHIMGVSKVLLKKWIGYYLAHGGELIPADAVVRKCLHPSPNSAIESIHRSEIDVQYHDDHINEILNSLWIEPVEEEATGAIYFTILCKSSPGVAGDEFDIIYDLHHAKEHGFITKDRVAEFVWQTHPLDWRMLFKLNDQASSSGSAAGQQQQQQKKKAANQKQKQTKTPQPQLQSVA